MVLSWLRVLVHKLTDYLFWIVNWRFNYQGPGRTPAVTAPTLLESNVRVAASMLLVPHAEIYPDFDQPPRQKHFTDLLKQLEDVQASVAAMSQSFPITMVHDRAELAHAMRLNKVALVHAVEGGFHLGDETQLAANVAMLKALGVVYVTLAHLLYRGVATNANGLPFLPDWLYRVLFRQPPEGLSAYGKKALEAMVDHRILVDLTHMSEHAIDDTLAILERHDDGDRKVPVIAGHSACRAFKGAEYNLSDRNIRRIADRGGVIGLIACKHWMATWAGTFRHGGFTRGMRWILPFARTFGSTIQVIHDHIDHILHVTGGNYDCIALGSDQDGFIKPALPDLAMPEGFVRVEEALVKAYGPTNAAKICSGNALRVLNYALS
jgi:microsomal dipeptidase-like Zn-dependent dipeptidase